MLSERKQIQIWLTIFFAVFAWSLFRPHDYFTWVLEAAPAVIGLVILALTYRIFRLTALSYWLILIHAVILFIGAHYTYAEVPLFNWLRDTFELSRNHYDKVGHFAQGFFPAIVAREILIRTSPLAPGKWLFFIVVCVCLAVSAFYEMIEWWVAAATGEAADAFLGTQGYIWDTQSDMALAMVGAICAQVMLGKPHNKSVSAMRTK